LGIFSVLGKLYNVEITVPIVAALLTILGFSVHDTIVIFDRIRENILRKGMGQFEETVNWSLNQTLGRSISTVLTVELVLLALYFFGGQTLKYFALALIIGITSGAYSSIFIASPLLVTWYKFRRY
jgi:preprotein translocase subunit SecF